MQHFVDGLAAQCRRHGLSAELILVDWNPPRERPRLSEAVRWPSDPGPLTIRVITVPHWLHARLAYADVLPLFQMIAKNVGIRRAHGRFVLATNIDILLSDNVVRFMSRRLRASRLYRLDRADVPPELPADAPFEEVLAFCRNRMFRLHKPRHTLVRRNGKWVRLRHESTTGLLALWRRAVVRRARAAAGRAVLLARAAAGRAVLLARHLSGFVRNTTAASWRRRGRRLLCLPRRAIGVSRRWATGTASSLRTLWRKLALATRTVLDRGYRLHTNACGDFTLMSRQDWHRLRGYPEWEIFSWHIDSVLLHQAHRSGIREVDLPADYRVYHIEHDAGSGYTPEGAESLFERLDRTGLPYIDWPGFLDIVTEMDRRKRASEEILYNGPGWGFADHLLPETVIGAPEAPMVRAC